MERLEAKTIEKRRRLAANSLNIPDALEDESSGWFLGRELFSGLPIRFLWLP